MRMQSSYSAIAIAVTAAAGALGAAPVLAQDVAAGATEQANEEARTDAIADIVVTAQRREQNVQDVPISISAFSSDQLQAQGVSSAIELARYVPNLIATNNTGIGTANTYFMRGLGNADSFATMDSPVGTYVDDIYIARQNANNFSMFDVERIEVLHGPQGTLFGRNTTGGAIAVIMRKPGDRLGGQVEIGYGSHNKKLARGTFDLPLGPDFAVKVSGYWQDDDGYVKNVTTGDRLNEEDGWGIRIGARANLGSGISWSGSFSRTVSEAMNILNFSCNPANLTDCKGRFVTTGYTESGPQPFAALGVTGRKARFPQLNEGALHLATSNLEVELGDNATLNFITGYVNTTNEYGLDFFDGRGGPSITNPRPPVRGYVAGGFTLLNDATTDQFSQEVKVNASLFDDFVDLVVGAYYLDEKSDTEIADVFSVSPTTVLVLGDRLITNGTRSYAGYAQADVHVSSTITLTAGIRYTDERKTLKIADKRPSCNDGTIEATCLFNPNLRAANGLAIPTKLNSNVWTPRFAINFKPNDDLLLFASLTKGFKSGGWNARSTSVAQMLPFGPETVWSYEAGIKSEWFDRRVRVNVTGYYTDLSDLQIPSGLIGPTGALTFITRNFADFEDYGLEAELTVVPVDGLNLYANIGMQRGKYIIDPNSPNVDAYGTQSVAAQQRACRAAIATGAIPGGPGTSACGAGIVKPNGDLAQPVRTPKLTLAVGGRYVAKLGNGMQLVPSINAMYHSRQEVGTSNASFYMGSITGTNGTFPANFNGGTFVGGSRSDATWLINAGLALNGGEDRWQLVLDCQNCFNKDEVQSQIAGYSFLNPPRTWSLRARYRF